MLCRRLLRSLVKNVESEGLIPAFRLSLHSEAWASFYRESRPSRLQPSTAIESCFFHSLGDCPQCALNARENAASLP